MRITLIGSGNVATHLGAAFKNAGHNIVQVYSPDIQNASLLAYHVGAEPVDAIEKIMSHTDIFIIAVKDDAITNIAEKLSVHNILMVHTSGATGIEAISKFSKNCGVFYPLQTFSKLKEVDFKTVPVCIEGTTEEITLTLTQLAQTVSNSVYRVNSDQRKTLHLAAVFACNFPNYLYNIAQQILWEQQLNFDLLRPLIKETADKVQQQLPADVQTGPALRNDAQTMQTHLEMLGDQADLQKIYSLLSEDIIKMAKTAKTA